MADSLITRGVMERACLSSYYHFPLLQRASPSFSTVLVRRSLGLKKVENLYDVCVMGRVGHAVFLKGVRDYSMYLRTEGDELEMQ